jgi:hypothetical protein
MERNVLQCFLRCLRLFSVFAVVCGVWGISKSKNYIPACM